MTNETQGRTTVGQVDRPLAEPPLQVAQPEEAAVGRAQQRKQRDQGEQREGSRCMRYPFSSVRLGGVDRAEGPEELEHDGERDDRFGRRQHDAEEGEDLAVELAGPEAREGDQVEERRVQHQLDPHEDGHRVPPRDQAVEPEGEQEARHDEVVAESDVHGAPPSPPARAFRSCPGQWSPRRARAARSSTEMTSNGST